jgi:hypothetical protein
VKKCAVKGAGLQRAQLPPGNWFAPPGSNRDGSGGNKAVGAFDLGCFKEPPIVDEKIAFTLIDLARPEWAGFRLTVEFITPYPE